MNALGQPLMGAAPADLERRIVGRPSSLFAADMNDNAEALAQVVRGRSILVVGGGGSIGSATTELLVELRPARLHVVDISENYLAELVRSVRNGSYAVGAVDFQTLPIDFGSAIMQRFLQENGPYDVVLNFAALKHVRSEKDPYSLLQMIDTNVVRQARFRRWLTETGCGRYFVVSTDKAANPTSLMGATKRLMEDVLFDARPEGAFVCTSARFANVAFSNGSLLQSFLCRLAARQPLAAPCDTRRYFISRRESRDLPAGVALGRQRARLLPVSGPGDGAEIAGSGGD